MFCSYTELHNVLYVRTPLNTVMIVRKHTEGVNMLVLHVIINSRMQLVQVEGAIISNMVVNTDGDCIIRDGCERRQWLSHVMVANTDSDYHTWWLRTPTATASYVMFAKTNNCIIRDGCEHRQRLYHTWWLRKPTTAVPYVMVANTNSACIIRDGCQHQQRLCHTWWLPAPTATVSYVMVANEIAYITEGLNWKWHSNLGTCNYI